MQAPDPHPPSAPVTSRADASPRPGSRWGWTRTLAVTPIAAAIAYGVWQTSGQLVAGLVLGALAYAVAAIRVGRRDGRWRSAAALVAPLAASSIGVLILLAMAPVPVNQVCGNGHTWAVFMARCGLGMAAGGLALFLIGRAQSRRPGEALHAALTTVPE